MPKRPNVLFIQADQLAAPVLPAYGHKIVKTPNLDRIAERATVFESAYCNFPICAPSRFSMMSGQLPSRIGAYDNGAEFPSSVPTFAHYLRSLGYKTCLSGKMHFVGPDQLHGFEERVTTDIYPSDFGWTPDWTIRPHPVAPAGMNMRGVVEAGICARSMQLDYDDDVANQAVQKLYDFARNPEHEPFLLVASFTHPHNPFTITREYWDLYKHEDIDMPAVEFILPDERDAWSRRLYYLKRQDEHQLTDEGIRNARHAYYGMVSYVDALVGRLLNALEATGLGGDTVVIFTSDHGEMLGERGSWHKFSPFEWSSRVPLLIRMPGAKGRRENRNVSLVDLLPTLLDIAGDGKAPPLYDRIDGDSVANMLYSGNTNWKDEALIEYTAEGTFAPGLFLKKGECKYVYCETDPGMLYDLKTDPKELNNVHDHPEYSTIAAQMRSEVFEHWDPVDLKQRVIASQQKRHFLQSVLLKGTRAAWDYQPFRDAAQQYVRSAITTSASSVKQLARLPYVAPTPPDTPRQS